MNSRDFIASVLLIGLTACHPVTMVNLRLSNPSLIPVNIEATNVDAEEHPLRYESKALAAATIKMGPDNKPILGPDGQPEVVPAVATLSWSDIRRMSKIKVQYYPTISTARVTLDPPLYVHDSKQPFNTDVSVGRLGIFDATASESTILELGKNMGGGNSELAERLVDILPLLGSAIIATFAVDANKRETAEVHGSIPLQQVKYEYATPIELRSSTTTNRSIVARASVSIPVYGSIASSMSNASVYNMAWSIKHSPYLNSAFNVGDALETATLKDLKRMKNLLSANPNATLAVIHRMHVIESASFGLTQGKSLTATGSAAIASVFTASGSYSFNLSDETYVTLPSLVLNVEYQKQGDRQTTITLIDELIKAKQLPTPTPTPAAPPVVKELKQKLLEGFKPIEFADPQGLSKQIIDRAKAERN